MTHVGARRNVRFTAPTIGPGAQPLCNEIVWTQGEAQAP